MALRKTAIRLVQGELQERDLYNGEIDGIKGPKTDEAVFEGLRSNAGALPSDWHQWSTNRQLVAFLQFAANKRGIDAGPVDGLWGQRTEHGYDALLERARTGILPGPWRDDEAPGTSGLSLPNPNDWPVQTPTALRDFYGEPCDESKLVQVRSPWRLTIAYNTAQHTDVITCHKKVADSLERVLGTVRNVYGEADIRRLNLHLYGGSYNCRNMRGGARYSTHAYGIALDWDPDHNRLRWGRDKARFARPEYGPWWEAWEKEGWRSLGREKNYDWMHAQAALLPS
ncbi:MAG: M15 family peptidase [Alphaproteobacteria bacterium]|nr:M15 family peptidase [Alphaproteobacteria bacterium]